MSVRWLFKDEHHFFWKKYHGGTSAGSLLLLLLVLYRSYFLNLLKQSSVLCVRDLFLPVSVGEKQLCGEWELNNRSIKRGGFQVPIMMLFSLLQTAEK